MKQEIEWFDLQNQADMATGFSMDVSIFQQAIGEKVSQIITIVSMFLTGFGISMAHGWVLTLVILASLSIVILSWYIFIIVSGR